MQRRARLAALTYARDFHRRHIAANPPKALTDQLPEPQSVPHLANSYLNAIIDATLYTRSYMPYPDSTTPYGNVLGARPQPTDVNQPQLEAYDNALDRIKNAATSTALRHIYTHDPQVPGFINQHVANLAATAQLTPQLDVDALTQWAHAANHHKNITGLLPTGPPPDLLTNPTDRARHRTLGQQHANALNPPAPNLDLTPALEQTRTPPRIVRTR